MSLIARFKQALFRWRSDGSAPLRLGQRRIFIVPSRPGLFFALALIVMLIGAINYNLTLDNERKAPRLALELEAVKGQFVEAAIAGESRITIRVPLPAQQRGWLALPRVRLSTR